MGRKDSTISSAGSSALNRPAEGVGTCLRELCQQAKSPEGTQRRVEGQFRGIDGFQHRSDLARSVLCSQQAVCDGRDMLVRVCPRHGVDGCWQRL